jgi:flagellar biogenesis protein FliO
MPDISQPLPLWFTFSTIGVLLALTGLGIWAVMLKKRKMNATKEA